MSTIAEYRTVANINSVEWTLMEMPGLPDEQVWWHNISYDQKTGQGSYLMVMAPGTRSNAHRHNGPEEFFMLEGNLIDHDGHEYVAGDFVSLSGGSEHYSTSPKGCKIVVTHRGLIKDLTDADVEQGQ